MYTRQDYTYAEAGFILKGRNIMAFSAPSEMGPFEEVEIGLDDMTVTDDLISFDIFSWRNPGVRTYADAKKFVVGKRYSNDDQIAIILNREDSLDATLAYEKMQEFRDWASIVARKIMEVLAKEIDHGTYSEL